MGEVTGNGLLGGDSTKIFVVFLIEIQDNCRLKLWGGTNNGEKT